LTMGKGGETPIRPYKSLVSGDDYVFHTPSELHLSTSIGAHRAIFFFITLFLFKRRLLISRPGPGLLVRGTRGNQLTVTSSPFAFVEIPSETLLLCISIPDDESSATHGGLRTPPTKRRLVTNTSTLPEAAKRHRSKRLEGPVDTGYHLRIMSPLEGLLLFVTSPCLLRSETLRQPSKKSMFR
jgi:hypothetical protein